MSAQAPLIADVVYHRTPRGSDELRSQLHGLSPRARQLLALLDGKRSAVQLLRTFPEDELAAYLIVLEIGEFVVPNQNGSTADTALTNGVDMAAKAATPELHALSVAASRGEFGQLRQMLLLGVLQRLGVAAEPFALAIMRCRRSIELRRLLPAILAVIEVGHGPAIAEQFATETHRYEY